MKVALVVALAILHYVQGSPFVPSTDQTFQDRYSSPKAPNSQCPLVTLKDNCLDQKSTCWSPGTQDIDCPNLGFCCFNGCVNVCLETPAEVPPSVPQKPECSIEYQEQEEVVEMNDCGEIPDVQTCVTTTSQECHSECSIIDKPETVTVEEECCIKDKELVCDLNPEGCHDGVMDADVTEMSCDSQEESCFDVPEQICHQEEVPECRPVETQECKTVRKPVEWPTTRQKCATTYKEECRMVEKVVCPNKDNYSKSDPNCKKRRVKECTQKPMESCEEIQTVTLEYEDAEECTTVRSQKCTTKSVTKCEMSSRRQCIEPFNLCHDAVKTSKKIPVKADCSIPDKICRFEDKVTCTKKQTSVEKWVPAKICQKVCKPVSSKTCTPRKTRKRCSKFQKRMFYDIPVQRCS